MSSQKPIMYPDHEIWQQVERYLIDGVWKIIQQGQVDEFNFNALVPNIGAVVLCRRHSKELKIYQHDHYPDEFERVLFDHVYRNNRFRNQGWYVWCLRDVKDYSTVKRPTLRAQLFVEEGYQKFRPELDLEQDYQSPAGTKVFTPTVLDAPSVRVLNCTGQNVSIDSLTDNTFMVEGEGAFVGSVEINITDPNRAVRSKTIQTEGLMRSYRTWKHPISKVIPGIYKVQVKSVDGKVQHSETVKFVKAALQKGLPSTSVTFVSKELALPQYTDGVFTLTMTGTISGKLKATNKNAITEAEFDRNQFNVQARQECGQIFSGLQVKDIEGDLSMNPTITFANDSGNYAVTFETGTVYPDIITLTATDESKAVLVDDSNWNISGAIEFSIEIDATSNNNAVTSGAPQEVREYVIEYSEKIKNAIMAAELTIVAATMSAAGVAEAVAATVGKAVDIFYQYETPIAELVIGRTG